MKNNILLDRICHLIAMTRALEKETVLKMFEELGSIDRVLELTEKM